MGLGFSKGKQNKAEPPIPAAARGRTGFKASSVTRAALLREQTGCRGALPGVGTASLSPWGSKKPLSNWGQEDSGWVCLCLSRRNKGSETHTGPLLGGEAALQLKGRERSARSNYVFIIIPKLLCHKSHFPSGHVAAQPPMALRSFPAPRQLTAAAGPWEQPAGGSSPAIPARDCRPGRAEPVWLRKPSPPGNDCQALWTIKLLLGFFFFF